MLVRKLSFVESAELLKKILEHEPWDKQSTVTPIARPAPTSPEKRSGKGDLVSLAHILRSAGIVSSK